MNYAEMSDAEINVEVAKLIFPASEMNTPYYHRPDVYIYHRNETSEHKDYCNSWADAGPIIQEYGIGLMPFKKSDAAAWDVSCGLLSAKKINHENPLRAAMIVFLMMQEGK